MSERKDLLIEIGTEELPPKALRRLMGAFAQFIEEGIHRAGLHYQRAHRYATPRRLAVLIEELETAQPDKQVQRRGPALTAAFKEDGCPSPAALGFAKSCGVEVEQLEKFQNEQGAWLVHNSLQKGSSAAQLLPDIIKNALDKLPIPKRMRWGALQAQFVRPVHWLVILLGDEVIEAEILSVKAQRDTYGHRFHHPQAITLTQAKHYLPLLESQGHVIADFEIRREAVRAQVLEAAAQLKCKAVIDEALLDEVTSMVEWPVAITGNFEPRFLNVPAEALISTMKNNQKYFHLVDEQGRLLPHFITVANVDSTDKALIQHGNERVIRPRLVDAEFFWNQDRKQSLESRLEKLKQVVFQTKLGSVFDKVQRVVSLSHQAAEQLHTDVLMTERAAWLCKCDLMTDMVYEFPELQGVMGRYYAMHDGEPQEIADALDEVYMPRFAGDRLPHTTTGQIISIADKLDTIVGIFAIGQTPSGDKDPFGLRRAALGVLRIMIERQLELDLKQLLEHSARAFKKINANSVVLVQQTYEYIMERLRAYYLDNHVGGDVFDAVYARAPARPADFDKRIRAVSNFIKLPQAHSLAASNKRIANIIKKADSEASRVDSALLVEAAERVLFEQIHALDERVKPMFDVGEYKQGLNELAQIRDSVDRFFDDVMVMTDDEKLKNNRLALLSQLRALFLHAADLSCLQMN